MEEEKLDQTAVQDKRGSIEVERGLNRDQASTAENSIPAIDSRGSLVESTLKEEQPNNLMKPVTQQSNESRNYFAKWEKILSKKNEYYENNDSQKYRHAIDASKYLNLSFEATVDTGLLDEATNLLLKTKADVYLSIASDHMDAAEALYRQGPYEQAIGIQERVIPMIETSIELLRKQQTLLFNSSEYAENSSYLASLQLQIEKFLDVTKSVRTQTGRFSAVNPDYTGPRFFERS